MPPCFSFRLLDCKEAVTTAQGLGPGGRAYSRGGRAECARYARVPPTPLQQLCEPHPIFQRLSSHKRDCVHEHERERACKHKRDQASEYERKHARERKCEREKVNTYGHSRPPLYSCDGYS